MPVIYALTTIRMEGETTKSLNNGSRCIFFNTDSDDYRCVSKREGAVALLQLA